MISNLAYQHRFGSFFTEPLVAGLDPDTNKPYICSMDTIGCIAAPNDFVAVGTGQEYLLGVCESKCWYFDMYRYVSSNAGQIWLRFGTA